MAYQPVALHDAEVECGSMGGRLASFLLPEELPGTEVVIPGDGLWLGEALACNINELMQI